MGGIAIGARGEHLYQGPDAEEKRAIGAVWSARSGGKCLFVMPTNGDFAEVERRIRLTEAL